MKGGNVLRSTTVLCASCLTDERVVALLKRLGRELPIVFVGDMDPYAIVQYEETRRRLARGATVTHGGVNSAWLDAIDRRSKDGKTLGRIRIALERHEVELLKAIERCVDLEALVGARGARMLRDGFKVELEGAMNPALHPRDHGGWMLRYLRSRLRVSYPPRGG